MPDFKLGLQCPLWRYHHTQVFKDRQQVAGDGFHMLASGGIGSIPVFRHHRHRRHRRPQFVPNNGEHFLLALVGLALLIE